MPPIIVVGSLHANFAVWDAGGNTVTVVNPSPGAAGQQCVIDAGPSRAAVGLFRGQSSQVQLYDISNPVSPARLATASLPAFDGVGAIAIQDTLVAAGQQHPSGGSVALIDFTNLAAPVVLVVTTPLREIVSVAFTTTAASNQRKVVAAGTSGPPFCVEVDFTVPTNITVTTFASPVAGGACILDADPASGRIVIANQFGGTATIVMVDAATKLPVANRTVTTNLPGCNALAISGTNVLAGSDSSRSIRWIDFAGPPTVQTLDLNFPPVDVHTGTGAVVAIEGVAAAVGQAANVNTQPMAEFILSNPISSIRRVDSKLGTLNSMAFGRLTGPPPGTPIAEIVPATLAFGLQRVGTQAPARTVTLTNSGSGPLTITAVTSSNAQRFPITVGALPVTLLPGPGQQLQVSIGFAPNSEAGFTGQLNVTSNGGSPSVSLSGTGALPHIALSPSALDLGRVFFCGGQSSVAKEVTIANTGQLDLTVNAISAAPPFHASQANAVVRAQQSARVAVRFTPAAVGPAAGTLTITSDDPTTPNATVALSAIGDPPQPPLAVVPSGAQVLGTVRRSYFAAKELVIRNASVCQPLVLNTLTVTGAGFSLTNTNEVTGLTTIGPFTVAPNGVVRPMIVFAPTTLGAAAGTLTITSNDPQPIAPIAVTGTGVDGPPAALELVLDRSASMAMRTTGATKLIDLQRTVALFAEMVVPDLGDDMGSVQFSDQRSTLTPIGPFTAARQSQIASDAASLTPLGQTEIGRALQLAQSELQASAVARKVILLFTDGIETGPPPTIDDVRPAIIASQIEAYAVGLGRPQDVSSEALSKLAWSSNGKFFLTDEPLLLRKHFVQVLADAFRQEVATDPVHTIDQGQTMALPVSLTNCERRVTFILAWENSSAQLGLEIESPDGTVYTPGSTATNRLVRYGQDVVHSWYQITFPEIDPAASRTLGPRSAGTWTMRVTGAQVAAPARFTSTVLVDSDLEMQVKVAASDTTRPLVLDVTLTDGGARLNSANVMVRTTSPTRSVAEIYGSAALQPFLRPRELSALTGPSLLEQAILALQARRYNIPTRNTVASVTAARGVYRLDIPPPHVPGVYQFEIEVTGQACGGTFQRYSNVSIFVGAVATPATTGVTIGMGPGNTATIRIRPTTGIGQALGPGLVPAISASIAGGTIGGVTDNLDGSYTITARWPEGRRRPMLDLDIGGVRMQVPIAKGKQKPVPRPTRRRAKPTPKTPGKSPLRKKRRG
jgi:hypothetical protein